METKIAIVARTATVHLETFLGGMETQLFVREDPRVRAALKPSLVEWKLGKDFVPALPYAP